METQKRLTLDGCIVISVGLFGHSGDDDVWKPGVKEMLDDMHLRKIDMADEIFVINVGGYIGESTKREIANHLKKFEPAINIAVQYIEIPNKAHFYVIAIHFDHKEFTQSPYTYDGRAYYKLESTTTLMPREMYNEKLRKMYPSHYSWEKLPAKNVAIEDLDEEQMVRTIQDGVNKGRIPALAMRSLSYFVDAEKMPMPKMLMPFDWEDAKDRIRAAVRKLAM